MGYRSQVYLKTTTEGYLIIKRFNASIEAELEKPLNGATVQCTPAGFYKISFDDVKWYEGTFKEVDNFMLALDVLKEQDIPYSFIRIGEDIDDIVHDCNWTDDIPDEISNFEPVVDVNDDDSAYETIMESGKDVKYKDLFTPPAESEEGGD